MARKFLIVIAALTGLLIVAAIALTAFQDELIQALLVPSDPFDAKSLPPAPDYDIDSGWAARGSGKRNTFAAQSTDIQRQSDGEVAIFFVHATSYWSKARWNGPIDNPESLARLNTYYMKGQASIANPFGALYAPYYRQATLGAFFAGDQNTAAALSVAYGDVLNAFEAFLAARGNRPILLVGHSQGSLHLLTLLHTVVAKRGLESEIIAAYLVGWPISKVADLPPTMPSCATAKEVNCVLSWQTFGPQGSPDMIVANLNGVPTFNGVPRPRDDEGHFDLVCINPITFDMSKTAATAKQNPGGIAFTGGDAPLGEPLAGVAGARCGKDGFLYLDREPDKEFQQYLQPGGNYHIQDYQLFYRSVQQNMADRMDAYFALENSEAR